METFIIASLTAASLGGLGYICGRRITAAKDGQSHSGQIQESRRREVLLHEARNLLNAVNLRLFELEQLHQTAKPDAGDELMTRLIADCVTDATRIGRVLAEMSAPSPNPLFSAHLPYRSQHDRPSQQTPIERASATI